MVLYSSRSEILEFIIVQRKDLVRPLMGRLPFRRLKPSGRSARSILPVRPRGVRVRGMIPAGLGSARWSLLRQKAVELVAVNDLPRIFDNAVYPGVAQDAYNAQHNKNHPENPTAIFLPIVISRHCMLDAAF